MTAQDLVFYLIFFELFTVYCWHRHAGMLCREMDMLDKEIKRLKSELNESKAAHENCP